MTPAPPPGWRTWQPRQAAGSACGLSASHRSRLGTCTRWRTSLCALTSLTGRFASSPTCCTPSSVGTATGFHVPVIAPALPAVAEITHGQQRWLAPPGTGLGQALATAEADIHAATRSHGDPRGHRPAADAAIWWRRITCAYRQAADDLRQQRPYPTLQGDPSGA
jgi:hypothetical protein